MFLWIIYLLCVTFSRLLMIMKGRRGGFLGEHLSDSAPTFGKLFFLFLHSTFTSNSTLIKTLSPMDMARLVGCYEKIEESYCQKD